MQTIVNEVRQYFACETLTSELKESDRKDLKETEKTARGKTTREYFITDDIGWFED